MSTGRHAHHQVYCPTSAYLLEMTSYASAPEANAGSALLPDVSPTTRRRGVIEMNKGEWDFFLVLILKRKYYVNMSARLLDFMGLLLFSQR